LLIADKWNADLRGAELIEQLRPLVNRLRTEKESGLIEPLSAYTNLTHFLLLEIFVAKPIALVYRETSEIRMRETLSLSRESQRPERCHLFKITAFHVHPARCSLKTWLLNQTVWRIKDQLRRRLPVNPRTDARIEDRDRTATTESVADSSAEEWQAHWEADWKKAVLTAALRRVKAEANLKDCQMFELS
jgi:hypothetical protein